MKKQSVSVKFDLEKYQEIKEYYSSFIIPSSGEYVDFVALKDEARITGFSSNKSKRTITFEGDDALLEAKLWDESVELKEVKEMLR